MIATCAHCLGAVARGAKIVPTDIGWTHADCAGAYGPTPTGEVITNHTFYYVSILDGRRRGLLLGPYSDYETARSHVDRGRELADSANPWACFAGFGVASSDLAHATIFGV